ncbi:hypothetical protein RZN22_08165 [Bacillaceae bacterium S4-13-58]
MQTEGISVKENVQVNIRPYSKPNPVFNKKTLVACMMSGSILASPLNTSAQGIQDQSNFTNKQGSHIIRTSIQSYNGSKSHEQIFSSPKIEEADDNMKDHENVENILKETDYDIEIKPAFKFQSKLSFDKEIKIDYSEESNEFHETDYEIEVKSAFNFK